MIELITPADVALYWAEHDPWDPSDPDHVPLVRASCQEAQDFLEMHIGRRLSVGIHEDAPPLSRPHPMGYEVLPRTWPVIQVLDPSPLTFSEDAIYFESAPESVRYIAGYRHAAHTLAELQAEIPELTVLPPEVPARYRRAMALLAIEFIKATLRGGEADTDQTRLGESITILRPAPDAIDRVLRLVSMDRYVI